MNPIKSTFFPFEAKSAKRSTKDQSWLMAITEEQAIAEEAKWQKTYNRFGQEWWVKKRLDKKTNQIVDFGRKSPPNYVSTRKYLLAQANNRDAIRDYAEKIGFVMPQDCFMVIYCMRMPKSWTKKKKASMAFQRHKNKKDIDNLVKNTFDAICKRRNSFLKSTSQFDDARISSFAGTKIYIPDNLDEGFYINEYLQKDWDDLFLSEFKNGGCIK
jgi:Holliday junction resolvase RusA-like endonuclease